MIFSTSISIAPRIHIGKNYPLMVFCWNFNWQKRNVLGTFYIKWKSFKLHLKRKTYSCFINNYNPGLLKARQAKTGLQPVYNYYKAVSHMTAYFLKSENSTSVAMKEVVQEIKLQNLSARVAIKKLADSFICSRLMSVQEAVYLCLPELWLRKCQQGVMFLNTNLPYAREGYSKLKRNC